MDDSFVMIPERNPLPQHDMPVVFRMSKLNNHDLYEITVDELQHLFSSGDLTCLEYTKFCLERIRKVGRCVCSVAGGKIWLAETASRVGQSLLGVCN